MKPLLLTRDRFVTDVNIAVMMSPTDRVTMEHPNRPFHGLAFNVDGEPEYHFSDGAILAPKPGEVIYLPRTSTYFVTGRKRGFCGCINFLMQELPDEPCPLPPFTQKVSDPAQTERIYREADRHWRRHEPYWKDHARAALYQLFALLRAELDRPYLGGHQQKVLDTAIAYIDDHFTGHSITVGQLAELCGVSEVWLRRLFVSRYGVTPSRYIMNRRIERAKELITADICTIENAGQLSGFEDPSHFSRTFKAEVGLTPGQFRDQNKENRYD